MGAPPRESSSPPLNGEEATGAELYSTGLRRILAYGRRRMQAAIRPVTLSRR